MKCEIRGQSLGTGFPASTCTVLCELVRTVASSTCSSKLNTCYVSFWRVDHIFDANFCSFLLLEYYFLFMYMDIFGHF